MQPASLDLVLEHGDDALVTFRFRNSAAAPITLGAGEVTLELRWPGGGIVLEDGEGLTVNGAAGDVVWGVTAGQLAAAPLGRITTLRLVRTTVAEGRRSYAVGVLTLTDGPAPGDQTATLTVQALSVTVEVTTGGVSGVGDIPGLQTALDGKQPADADLTALAGASANGLWARTGAGTGAARTLTGTAGQIAVTNGDGVAGNPVVGLPAAVAVTTSLAIGGASLGAHKLAVAGSLEVTATGRVAFGSTLSSGAGAEFYYSGGAGYFNVVDRSAGFVEKPLTMALSVLQPYADNTASLGGPSNRWSVVYAGTGAINTCDRADKSPAAPDLIDPQTGAVTALGLRIAALIPIRAFQWLASIALKGEAAARIHFGWYAQDWQAAFEAEGLDPSRYGLWCRDEVREMVTEGGLPVTRPKLDPDTGEPVWRLGLRPDQCLAFLLAAQATRLAALEAALSDEGDDQ